MIWLIAFIVLCTAFHKICFLIGGIGFSSAILGLLVASNTTIMLAGLLLLERFRAQFSAQLPAAYLTGFGIVSFALMVMTYFFGLSPYVGLLAVVAVTFVALVACGLPKLETRGSDIGIGIAIVGAILALSASAVGSPETLQIEGNLPTWYDAYIHGITIHALNFGEDAELAGASFAFYHYGPFMLPAVFAETANLDGLTLATSYLLPFGILIGAFGFYVFCTQLGGRTAAILGLAILVLIPDPSEYLLESGWLDVTWLLYASPGAGYAVGLCFVAATSIYMAGVKGARNLYALAALLLITVIFERVHFFMLAAPALLGVGLMNVRPSIRRRLFWIAGAAAFGVGLLLSVSPEVRADWISFSRPFEYLDVTLRWSENYARDIEPYLGTGFWGRTTQLAVNLIASLGIFFFAAPLLGAYKVRRLGCDVIDSLPLFLVVTYLALILFAPPASNGDISEYKHRHFILLYAAFVAMFAVWTVQIGQKKYTTKAVAVLGVTALIVALMNYKELIDAPNGKATPWAADYHGRPIASGLVDAASFISESANARDILTADVANANLRHGPLIEMLSQVPVRAYLARGELKVLRSDCHSAAVEKRLENIGMIDAADSWAAASEAMRDKGIRWYVQFDGPADWDPNAAAVAYSSASIHVYDSGIEEKDHKRWKLCASSSK